MRVMLLVFALLSSASLQADCVILLHGLARTEGSLKKMEKMVEAAGYQAVNKGYPSRKHSIALLAGQAIAPALENCSNSTAIHFITHSLGGILVRQYLSEHEIPNLKRVVMLGPPNQGSEVVDKLGWLPGFGFLNGRAGFELGTSSESVPNRLGAAKFDVGVIAGTSSINWILSMLIPGDDDGKVSLQNARLEGMNDFIELPVTHPFMMKNDKVIEQAIFYLENGFFRRDDVVNVN
ncbi:MAG: alpha/beta hydrolase [Gammaproteobacteria bacterium]|nr:alpha/beta hydrolase [Gammaproteobacteria bacterium]NND38968.1 alpha/beta hydrolase [Pseudomonadales bacterium]MBT8151914.1 alpha/beta hydrolase [Gammaproteobacteria bacterium]NNL11530.1 alpha/beta hydrolase [Pseudomonadales bacterium]NNM10968.1 alpha/beta hydrolase [Pseudomonadales bacterium]